MAVLLQFQLLITHSWGKAPFTNTAPRLATGAMLSWNYVQAAQASYLHLSRISTRCAGAKEGPQLHAVSDHVC